MNTCPCKGLGSVQGIQQGPVAFPTGAWDIFQWMRDLTWNLMMLQEHTVGYLTQSWWGVGRATDFLMKWIQYEIRKSYPGKKEMYVWGCDNEKVFGAFKELEHFQVGWNIDFSGMKMHEMKLERQWAGSCQSFNNSYWNILSRGEIDMIDLHISELTQLLVKHNTNIFFCASKSNTILL